MSQVNPSNELEAQSQELLQGPLKHARAAALALALVPLAAVAVTTAAQEDTACPASGGICGTVFYDTNGNGIQEAGEGGYSGASVTVTYTLEGATEPTTRVLSTDENGFYQITQTDEYPYLPPPGTTYTISVQRPPDTTASPDNNPSTTDLLDSDGVPDTSGNSVAHFTVPETDTNGDSSTDFGFTATSGFTNPGTGTPGYWKNHPEAWPVSSVTVGGVSYTKQQAIDILNSSVTKDKRYTMFSSLVPALLNVKIGNDDSCVSEAIAAAQHWMTTYGPITDPAKAVAASSYAWKVGEPTHRKMDNYNNGMLCAPHRD
jgi:hypothetical protein